MKTATVRELRNDFGRLAKWLEAGETIEIIKRGKPVAGIRKNREKYEGKGGGAG